MLQKPLIKYSHSHYLHLPSSQHILFAFHKYPFSTLFKWHKKLSQSKEIPRKVLRLVGHLCIHFFYFMREKRRNHKQLITLSNICWHRHMWEHYLKESLLFIFMVFMVFILSLLHNLSSFLPSVSVNIVC